MSIVNWWVLNRHVDGIGGKLQFFTHYTDDNISLPAPALHCIVGGTDMSEEGEGTRVDFKYELHINEEQYSEHERKKWIYPYYSVYVTYKMYTYIVYEYKI